MKKIFFLPVNTGYAVNGEPTDLLLRFYSQRCGNGLYCAIVGNVVIPNGFGTNSFCAKISVSRTWQELANTIKSQGAKPGIQLSSTWNRYIGMTQFESQNIRVSKYIELIESFSKEDVQEVFNNLRYGIELSAKAGFSHIQIHAAHGYIFSLLVDGRVSRYSDFCLEELYRIAKDLSNATLESSLRISLLSGNKALDIDREQLICRLCALPFSFLDLSSGYYNENKYLIYPRSSEMLNIRLNSTIRIANLFPFRQIILSGKSQGIYKEDLPPNIHIGIARDLIANPRFLMNYQDGCIDCMQCHYYSTGKESLSCGRW